MEFHGFVGVVSRAYAPEFCASAVHFYRLMTQAGFVGDSGDPVRASGRVRAPAELYAAFNTPFWSAHYLAYIRRFGVLQSAHTQACATVEIRQTPKGATEPPWRGEDDERVWTYPVLQWMVFLDGVDDGGELVFHHPSLSIRPEEGTLVIWPSAFTHAHTLQPPRSGERHVLRGWVEAK